jgi:hypothetical protein
MRTSGPGERWRRLDFPRTNLGMWRKSESGSNAILRSYESPSSSSSGSSSAPHQAPASGPASHKMWWSLRLNGEPRVPLWGRRYCARSRPRGFSVAVQAATSKLNGSSKRWSPLGRGASITSPAPYPTEVGSGGVVPRRSPEPVFRDSRICSPDETMGP